MEPKLRRGAVQRGRVHVEALVWLRPERVPRLSGVLNPRSVTLVRLVWGWLLFGLEMFGLACNWLRDVSWLVWIWFWVGLENRHLFG